MTLGDYQLLQDQYNVQDDIDKIVEEANGMIAGYNPEVYFKNKDEMLGLFKTILDYKPPKLNESKFNIPIAYPWFYKEPLINKTKELQEKYNNTIDPEKNEKLNIKNTITKNLSTISGLLNQIKPIGEVENFEGLVNTLNLPDNFETGKLLDVLKTPNLKLNSLDELVSKLGIPNFNLNEITNLVNNVSIPNINFASAGIQTGGRTGLNFNRMKNTVMTALLREFPEGTDIHQMVQYQSQEITKAVFIELSKMKFYIEPGEITVLTNGSPSTHRGNNTNRITIKIKK